MTKVYQKRATDKRTIPELLEEIEQREQGRTTLITALTDILKARTLEEMKTIAASTLHKAGVNTLFS